MKLHVLFLVVLWGPVRDNGRGRVVVRVAKSLAKLTQLRAGVTAAVGVMEAKVHEESLVAAVSTIH